jgi:hypothetical protein
MATLPQCTTCGAKSNEAQDGFRDGLSEALSAEDNPFRHSPATSKFGVRRVSDERPATKHPPTAAETGGGTCKGPPNPHEAEI